MKKFKSLFFIVTFVLSIVVLASCAIIDDTHIHCFVNNVCECGEIEESHEHHGYVNVTFKDENGKVLEEKEVILGTLIPEVDDLSKEGYQFAGWYHGEVKWNFAKDSVKGDMVLEARFVDNAKYEIIYQLAGGVFEEEVEAFYISGIGLEKLPTPVRENHVFLGWYLNGELVDGISNSRIGSITLVAKWQVLNGSISFDLNEGSFYEGVKVPDSYNEGEGLASLPKAYRNHYIFNGWILNGQIVDSISKEQRGAVLLEASWTPVVYEISYDLDGGEFSASEKAEYTIEDEFNLVDATKVGYTFLGWYLGNELVESVKVGTTGELNFKAKWQINKYTITFDSNGGSKVDALTQDYNSIVVAPTAPTREGYTFAGWDKDVPANMLAENITLTAKWNINKYTVTFKLENGEKDVVLTQDYQTTITAPVPERTGYTFAGWDKDVLDKVPAEDLVYTAKWNINKYTVTFKLENGEKDVVLTQDYQTTITSPVPERTGYTFAGWDKEVLDKVPAEDLVYTAKWNINKYTVTFKLGNDEKDVVLTQDYQTAITSPVPERTGYTFAGWDKEVLDKVPAEDLAYTAKWNINKYTVTFKLENGEKDVVLTQDYQTTITAPVPERTGYTFAGWDKEVLDKVPAEDLVYTAKWTINQYYLIINIDGKIEKVEYDYNEAILKPADPEKDGYTFAGWDIEVPANMPAEDVEIKATWKAVEYKISYDLVGGAIYEGTIYPSKAEKEFEIGDYYTDGGNLKADIVVSDISILSKNSLKYQFKILLNYKEELDAYEVIAVGENNITAKDLANGQTWTHALTSSNVRINGQVTVGQIIQMPELSTDMDPFTAKVYNEADLFISSNKQTYTIEELVKLPIATKVGYEFAGWYIGEDKVEEIAKGSTGDVSLVAKWNIVEYTISYDLVGGAHVGDPSDSYTVLEEVALGVATKVGYNFLGWYIGENKVEEIAKGSTGNISLVAKWEAIQYQINYDAQGGDLGIIVYTYELIGTDFLADFNKLADQSLTPTTFAKESSASVKVVFANAEFLAKWSWMFAFMLEDLKAVNPDATSAYLTDAYPVLEKMIAGDTTAILDNANARTMIRNNIGGMLLGAKGCPSNATYQKYAADFSETARQEALVKAANDANEIKYTIEDEVELIVPTRKGYEFLGWYIGEEKVEKVEVGTTGNLTLTAKWDAIEYQITYDLGNGTHDASPVVSYTVEDNITLGTASKRGYRFLGWLLNEELVTEIAKETTGNIELVASWEYQGVKSPITYTLNGGSWAQDYVAPETYDEGIGLDLSSIVPVYRGYRFAGWKLNEEIVTEISAEQIEAVTLVATWELETYQITYVLDGGNEDHGNPTSYNVTSDTIVLKPLTKADYEFVGWFDGETQVEQIEKGSVGNLTLTARWIVSSFAVEYNLNGGSWAPNVYDSFEDLGEEFLADFNTYGEASLTAETFFGSSTPGIKKAFANDEMLDKWEWLLISMKAHLTAINEGKLENEYLVDTFLVLDQLIANNSSGIAGSDKPGPNARTMIRAYMSGVMNLTKGSTGNPTFSAYCPDFSVDEVQNYLIDTPIYEYKSGEEYDLCTAEKVGYTFVGWVTEDDEVITSITSEQNGNLSLTAKWEANTYNITYDLNGGSFGIAYASREDMVDDFLNDAMNYASVTEKPNGMLKDTGTTTIGFANKFEKNGFNIYNIFSDATYATKWSWLRDYIIEATDDATSKEQLQSGVENYWRYSLGAFLFKEQRTSWPKSENFALDTKANGFWGTYVTKLQETYTTGSSIELPTPSKDGVAFAGWYLEGKKIDSPVQLTYGDIELVAHWAEKYDISFNSNDIKYYATRNDLVNDFVIDAKAWSGKTGSPTTMTSFATVFSAIYGIFSDATYGPKWSWLKEYILETTKDTTELNGINTKAQLTSGNETFWRYSLGAFLYQEQRTTWPLSEDFTVDANANGFWGTYVTNINSYASGSELALPTPVKEGYIFKCWVDENLNEYTSISESTSGDLVLSASWLPVVATVGGKGYTSFKDAYTGASNGDTILLIEGEYNLDFAITKSVTIKGSSQANTILTVTKNINPNVNASNIKFMNLTLKGSGANVAGVYFQDGANLETLTFENCNIYNMNTFIKTTTSDTSHPVVYNIVNCNFDGNGQFILWIRGNAKSINIEGCNIDLTNSGNVGNPDGSMFRILDADCNVTFYNNYVLGTLPETSGGIFESGCAQIDVQYNTFKDVTDRIVLVRAGTSGKTIVFNNNLYLDASDVVLNAVPSKVTGTGVTADTNIYKSEDARKAGYQEFIAQ